MKVLFRILFSVLLGGIFVSIVNICQLFGLLSSISEPWRIGLYVVSGLIGCVVGFFLYRPLWKHSIHRVDALTERLENLPLSEVLTRTLGIFIGLLLAWQITRPLTYLTIPYIGNYLGVFLSIGIYFVLGLLGSRLAKKHQEEIWTFAQRFKGSGEKKLHRKNKSDAMKLHEDEGWAGGCVKILDTSVIIDGRIREIIDTGFLEGPFLLSKHVLEELQHIADSADALKRMRGRRGLDLISEMQKQYPSSFLLDDQDLPRIPEVDAKLLQLTKQYQGKIVTNDYNLNKVAQVQHIPVLNINDLANALKPVVIPGETLQVQVIKEGKEPNQGLSYLDDGTMIVVENGKPYIGQHVHATVTSVLQTAAGKMIFVRVDTP